MEAKALQQELGRSAAVTQWVAETETLICSLAPEFAYDRADLYGFVTAAWPYDGSPTDTAIEFVNAATEEETLAALRRVYGRE